MVKTVAGGILLACLLGSCSLVGPHSATSPTRVPWGDYLPYVRDLANPFEIIEHPFLMRAPIYHLVLRIGDDLESLDGSMSVRYTNTSAENEDTIDFVLLPNIAPGSMTLSDARVDGRTVASELREGGILLHLDLPAPLKPGARAVISMSYVIRIPTQPVVGFGGLLSWKGELSLGYAYPMITASGRREWGKPPAWGDLTANPVSFYLVEVSYPKGLTLVAPGAALARSATGERITALIAFGPARDLFLALGKGLELASLRSGGTFLRSYAPAGQTSASRSILDGAARALALYEKSYGPYPYRELTFVGARFEAEGLEFPGMILLTSWLYEDAAKRTDGSSIGVTRELTVAHETAHQWFYALVGNNQLTEPWIDESMAQYSMWRYWAERHGSERAARLRRSFEWEEQHGGDLPLGKPVAAYTPQAYDLTIYGRGPLFIMALADKLGKSRFDRFLHELVATFRWRVITGRELELRAEAACGCSLEKLWQEWGASAGSGTPPGGADAGKSSDARSPAYHP